ncbi:Latisemin [Dactylella cylindrospora]|nr:Latisemin [Dactylella cylindrospora]
MRSFVLSLAVLAASVMAAPLPKNCVTEIKGDKVYEIYDVTVTSTVYVTAGAEPTTTSVPPPPPETTYAPPPPVTTEYVPPAPVYTPEPSPTPVYTQVYQAPALPEPTPEPSPEPEPEPEPIQETPSAPTSDDQKCLDAHNKFRAAHGAPALVWDQEMADYAKDKTQDCTMHHSGGPYGENLAFGYGDVVSAVTAWYNEKDQYDASSPGFQMSTGHFTQLIWKATTKLGCYNRQCGGSAYLMCEYAVPGNVMGNNGQYFTENVSV